MQQKIKCPFCRRTFKSFFALRVHCKKIHIDVRVCPICKRDMGNFCSLVNHLANHARRGDKKHAFIYLLLCHPSNSLRLKRKLKPLLRG